MTDPRFTGNAYCWSGLFSGGRYDWQEGLREVCQDIGDVLFIPSGSGYADWDRVADAAIARKEKALLLIGHSNGGYAITKVAQKVKPHGIKTWLCCFDRTMKRCPTMGSNVESAIDIWAGLRKLKQGDDFQGRYTLYPFLEESHTGVIGNPEAQRRAVEFGRAFKRRYGS